MTATRPSNPLIELANVTRRYVSKARETVALNSIFLEIARGDFVTVMGLSGAGKSTLLNILGMLDSPDEGRYVFDGVDVTALENKARCEWRQRRIGFVFQAFYLLHNLSALDNVGLPLLYRRMSRAQRRTDALAALKAVGLGALEEQTPVTMSGGQQQRVAIARALVGKPDLILADEPTGALDHATSHDIMAIMKTLNRDGITVIVVTHNPLVRDYANRCFQIDDGCLVEEPSTKAGP